MGTLTRAKNCRFCKTVLKDVDPSLCEGDKGYTDQVDPDYCSGKCRKLDEAGPMVGGRFADEPEEGQIELVNGLPVRMPATETPVAIPGPAARASLKDYLNHPDRYHRRFDPERLNWGVKLDAQQLKQAGLRVNRVAIPGDWDFGIEETSLPADAIQSDEKMAEIEAERRAIEAKAPEFMEGGNGDG
ncbi:hypothetical protein KAR91_50700 [Candidatus Pacearchaeota archaeon]|nr:hypothetical protein [Candidatus Pacearchaeota archaeon]